MDLQELIHLLSIVRFTNAKRILEIGTFDGFTALNVGANLPAGGEITTLDLPPERQQVASQGISNACDFDIVGSKFRGEKEAGAIRQIFGDSLASDWRDFGAPFDLIFIDGCHEYRFVMSDSLNALRYTRPGGTILWHDYGQAVDVSRAVDEVARTRKVVAISGTRIACCRV